MTPDATALRQGDRELTYAQLAQRSSRLAAGLAELGVNAGDRVAYLGINDISTFETLFATGLLGAVFVPLNTRLTPREVSYMLRDAGAQTLIVGHGVEQLVDGLATEDTPVETTLTVGSSLEEMIETHPALGNALGHALVRLDDPALLLFTSGTTGHPKAATLTHGNLTWNTVNQLAHFDIVSSDSALCIAPLFHAVGLGQVTLPILFKGGSVEVIPKFDAGVVLDLIERNHVTSFSGVPTMLQLMTEHPDWPQRDLSSLRYVVYGGSSVPARVAQAWLDRDVQVLQGYGMTEAGPGIYMALPDGAREHPVSIGVPHFFTDVAATEGSGVAPLEPGGARAELLVRGPHVFAGYWGRPEDDDKSQVGGAWFRTGDVVQADEDGWAYVVDRVKDMLISGGENVYPAEVEAVAVDLDGIRSAALVGVPDATWGEVGVLFVETTNDSTSRPDPERLREHLRSRLAKFKVPRHIHYVDQLPRNATGKIKRTDLRGTALHNQHDLAPVPDPRSTP